MTLKASNLLKGERKFQLILSRGKKIVNSIFVLRYIENKFPQDEAVVGVITSKKVSPKAVERNRARRIFKTAIRSEIPKFKPNLMIVAILRSNINGLKMDEVRLEIKKLKDLYVDRTE